MSIFDRIKRLARAEISEMKRVLSDRDAPPDTRADASGESARQRAIREAEEELARADDDVLAAEIEAGAALWGDPTAPPRPDVAEGASLWGHDERPAASEAPRTQRPTTAPYEGRTHAFPREIRDAYADLELPLGAPLDAVERAFRDMLHRYHPDKHAGDARRQDMAHELTIRIREARSVLTSWLAGTS